MKKGNTMGMPLPTMKKNEPIVSKRRSEPENMTPDQIGKFMKKHGIDEKEFAEILGCTIQAVRLWVTGQREFSVTNSRLLRMFDKHPQLIRDF